MADNTDLNAGTGGDKIVTREISHGGDTSKLQGVFAMGVSGSEGSYTAEAIGGDAANGLDVDVTRVSGSVAVTNAGITTIAGAVAGSEMQVDVLTMPTVTVNAHAVTNAGVFAVQVDGSALTALQLIDDPVATLGTTTYTETTTKGMIVGAVRRDADTTLVDTTNEIGPLQMNALGQLKVEAFSGETLPVSLATVPSHAVTNAGTFPVQVDGAALTALQLIDDPVAVLGTATYTEATTSGFVMGAVRRDADTTLVNTTNEIAPLQVDAAGRLKVEVFDGGDSHTVDNGGTFAVQVDGNALTALQLIDDTVFADDIGYTLSTHKVSVAGGIAVETDGTDPTAVAEADAAALRTDRQRNLLVNITHPRLFSVSADYASAQTNTSVQASPGASLSLYITDIVISNGATAGNITLLNGSGGTVVFEIYPAINGGVAHSLRNPIRLSAATALCITSTTVTTHSVNISGYIAP